jgi:hypothetical protein
MNQSTDPTAQPQPSVSEKPQVPEKPAVVQEQAAGEIGGPKGPEPTRYGDWEKNGIVSDF